MEGGVGGGCNTPPQPPEKTAPAASLSDEVGDAQTPWRTGRVHAMMRGEVVYVIIIELERHERHGVGTNNTAATDK